ncbi:hypothetical protein ABID16_001779 [Rhizobium aquaticum]|uniref:Secreted protein n=1 Tax=Rhizobium aquaticum TaxID=1549636 RepID=A0ABV2IY89_9HYPH
MTRFSLFFVSTFAAVVIAFVPQPGPETSSQLPVIKTRSLAAGGLAPVKARSLVDEICKSSRKQECKATLGAAGPRG